MPRASILTVREASGRLGISPLAVRQHIASGQLRAVKRAGSWWLDERAVERMMRQRCGSGRPLSPAMAWAVLLLASGDDAAADEMVDRDRYRSRARMWLLDHSLHEHAPRLRARAEMEEFDAHPAELKRIIKRPDVLPTGVSAGDVLGLLGRTSGVEMYAQAGERDGIVTEHALVPRTGPVRIRWVSDEIWPLLGGAVGGGVPRAAVLLDLLESDEPRVRREAARALAP